jgi:hypothetical protein
MTALWIVFGASSFLDHAAHGGINVLKSHVRHRQKSQTRDELGFDQ